MHAFIGPTLLASKDAQPRNKPFEIYDSRMSGFMVRIQPSGARSYYVRFGRNRRVVLGKVDSLPPQEARERCQKVLGSVAHAISGARPWQAQRKADSCAYPALTVGGVRDGPRVSLCKNGGKGGNRTLDPGIMSAVL